MVAKRSGLGRNLSALLGAAPKLAQPLNMQHLFSIALLRPGQFQPRRIFDEASLNELAHSIKQQGVLQPILVREIAENTYEIIAGERRFRAAQIAGLTEVPVICHQVDDQVALAMALVENLQRDDLNVIEEARALVRLLEEFKLTHQQVAELVGKSRSAVSNAVRLLQLTPEIHTMIEQGLLDMGHARCLLMLEAGQQLRVAELIKTKQLSVRETEKLVARVSGSSTVRANKTLFTAQLEQYEEDIYRLSEKLKAKITLKPTKKGGGQMIIHYKDDANLQKLLKQVCVAE